jgi:hypothetical protein
LEYKKYIKYLIFEKNTELSAFYGDRTTGIFYIFSTWNSDLKMAIASKKPYSYTHSSESDPLGRPKKAQSG